ncbi:MAG: glycosyltransferase [Anaerolineae bacterium]|nr:glycosyltransferase [Anaerolineae bacterium]
MTEKPIRILRLIVRLNVAGPTLQAILLTNAMRQHDYETYLACGGSPDEADSMLYVAHEYHVEPIYLPELFPYLNPLRNFEAFLAIRRLIQEVQPDIVHTHTTTAGFLGRIAARMVGVPVVVHTLHTHPFQGYYNQARTNLFIIMERIGAYFSDSIITLSESLRRELVDKYHITSKNRITVLPLGFDLRSFADVKRKQGTFRATWNIPAEAPLVGIIGRLLPVKNHPLFLTAAATVREQIPDAQFVIVGDGEQRTALQGMVHELGLDQAVTFTGWQQNVEQIYSDLDVLVTSSLNEGTPVPIIEAISTGCPVVATRVGGIPDLLEGGRLGTLVESGDADALANAIISTLRNPPDMADAQKTMLNRYSIERLADDLDSLYHGLLSKKKS